MNSLTVTLVLIEKDSKMLLGMKKRGFGEGRWNGFGGKVEKGETIEEAARRECHEEAGIMCHNLRNRGILTFNFEDETPQLLVHLFTTSEFEGEPQETDEMRPQWFEKHEIPFEHMWEDDRHWFPYLWDDKDFDGEFLFKNVDTLLKYTIEERAK